MANRDEYVEKLKARLELARGADEAWEKMRDAIENARSHFQK